MFRLNKILLIILIILSTFELQSATIYGKIFRIDSLPLPYANIFVKELNDGVVSDIYGKYELNIKAGTYTVIFSYLGYKTFEQKVTLKENQRMELNVYLQPTNVEISEIEIVANKFDKAKKIMKLVRAKKDDIYNYLDNYSCTSYVRTLIDKEHTEKVVDTTKKPKDYETKTTRQNDNLVEYVATTYYKKPGIYKDVISAYNDFNSVKPINYHYISAGEFGEEDIAPLQFDFENPNIFYKNSFSCEFNFYKNLLEFPKLCELPLVSPIASNSELYYKFEYESSFFVDSVKYDRINVIPLNKTGALFYGTICIEDKTGALTSVDLSINESVLMTYESFTIVQNYFKINDSTYVPDKTEIKYVVRAEGDKFYGETKITRKNFKINEPINSKIFNNQVISFDIDAFDKDSSYWETNRTIKLSTSDKRFIAKTDSLQSYYASDAYLDKQDSLFNRVTWWMPFVGYGHKNHYHGYEFYIGGLLEQINPFGIGGYRHRLPFYYNQYFDNGMLMESRFTIDYGFKFHDLKGKVGIGLTYYPLKFVRTFIEFGNFYEMVNQNAAYEQIFSRSNYVQTKSFSISQRMEIFNGLYSELTFTYSHQIPIDSSRIETWSNLIFGDLNKPIDFEEYSKIELKLELKYVIGQKYVIKKNRKIIIGTDLPEISFVYRKGIPEIFRSEVNYDYVELGAKGILNIGRLGESRWMLKAGDFLNKASLRIVEYKFFRGSDDVFFSDPVTSMQLLGFVMYTNNAFLQANYIHHFTNVLNKVPLIRYLKLSFAIGAGTLNIPSQNFYDFELFGGIEKTFRIKKQFFRYGFYAVTADSNLSKADFKIKFGISFFNNFTNKWGY